MKILLDTNALIWTVGEPSRLTAGARLAIRSNENELTASMASLWELAIKIGTGKLDDVGSSISFTVDEMRAQGISTLPIELPHIFRMERLDRLHGDPFDRIIIAQALEEGLPVVTADRIFLAYGVEVLW